MNREILIHALRNAGKLTFCIYLFVYLYKSFVIWELINPFQWIIDMPTYENVERFGGLMMYLFYQGSVTIFFYERRQAQLKHKEEESNTVRE